VPLTVEDFASPINVAWGFEWRDETYTINAGDEASISAGPVFIFGVGSDGFQGFPRESAGSFNSDSISAYIDTETDITDKFTLGAALRYEDYDSFGDTTNFKLSGRYQFTDNFALRGTVSTGFRAPTPGQINTLNVTTSADASGNLIPSGTYPVDNPVAQVLGATPLDAEESRSVTLGAVWQVSDTVDITIDVYDISIDDRIALFGPNTISAADAADLAAAGVPNAALLEGSLASFFTNGFDSRVKGIDIAITTTFELNSGDLLLDIRHNTNEQEVRNVVANTINTSRVFDLENQIPDDRTTVTLDYETSGMFGGYLRLNKYSDWSTTGGLFSPGDASDAFRYGGELIVDAEARFQLNDIFSFAVGGENIFDTEPDDENDFVLGLLGANTAITSPFGNNGGFWYLRLNADF
ncbi:MAG: TonB-dependent receptor, partial [Pseudomonadota bacterium]